MIKIFILKDAGVDVVVAGLMYLEYDYSKAIKSLQV